MYVMIFIFFINSFPSFIISLCCYLYFNQLIYKNMYANFYLSDATVIIIFRGSAEIRDFGLSCYSWIVWRRNYVSSFLAFLCYHHWCKHFFFRLDIVYAHTKKKLSTQNECIPFFFCIVFKIQPHVCIRSQKGVPIEQYGKKFSHVRQYIWHSPFHVRRHSILRRYVWWKVIPTASLLLVYVLCVFWWPFFMFLSTQQTPPIFQVRSWWSVWPVAMTPVRSQHWWWWHSLRPAHSRNSNSC